jgi:hypothetical protein
MDEKELERRLNELHESWRVAPEPPLEQMWMRIAAEAFAPAPPRRWLRTLLPLAATLVVGIGIGQLAPPLFRRQPLEPAARAEAGVESGNPETPARLAGDGGNGGAPFVGVATDYLERVTALLVTLAEESRGGLPVEHSKSQAMDLLSTTRLLMDGPQLTDPHLRELLEDLELVLAQIVRLPARHAARDVYLIDQALDQREVIPRLRVFLAENSNYQP